MSAAAQRSLSWMDPQTGVMKRVPLAGRITIGSAPSNQIVLDVAGVEPFHAVVAESAGVGFEVSAVGASRVVMGDRVVERERLLPGSGFEVGAVSFVMSFTPRPAPTRFTFTGGSYAAEPASRAPLVFGSLLALVGLGALAVTARLLVPYLARRAAETPAAAAAASSRRAAAAGPVVLPEEPFRDLRRTIVHIVAKRSFEPGFSVGSGFFIDPAGKVLTSYRVVAQSDYQQVVVAGQKGRVDARVLGYDEKRDLALLQAYARPPVPFATLSRDARLLVGQPIFLLAASEDPLLGVAVARGVVGARSPRPLGSVTTIQHDAPSQPYQRGAPIVDRDGRILGVNLGASGGEDRQTVAIPSDEVRIFLETAPN